MNLIEIRELYKNQEAYLDKEITVGGWVRSIRDSKAFGFIVINDGTFFTPLQVVYHDDMENFEEISKLNVGAAVVVTGTLVATPQAKQPFEIQAKTVTVEGASAPDYPLQKKRHSFEYLRTIAHLRPRTNTFQAVFRVRSLTAYALHKFFQERGFVYVHTPIITGSDCEGAGEMFRFTYLYGLFRISDISLGNVSVGIIGSMQRFASAIPKPIIKNPSAKYSTFNAIVFGKNASQASWTSIIFPNPIPTTKEKIYSKQNAFLRIIRLSTSNVWKM